MIADQKYRMTNQRQIILEEVRKLRSHPTADEIYERVRKRLPRISMGTVYRNLDLLTKTGQIKKVEPGFPPMRFDGNTGDHYHVVCMGCGRIEDIPVEPSEDSLNNFVKAMNRVTSYSIYGHNLELMGLCPNCMKEGKTSLGEKMQELKK